MSQWKRTILAASSPSLSQDNQPKDSIATTKIAFVVGPGYNSAQLNLIKTALEGAGAQGVIISAFKGPQPNN